MDDEPKLFVRIDDTRDSYKPFFDGQWAKHFLNDLTKNTPIDDAGFSLSASWRAAANTHSLPWVLVHSLEGMWNGSLIKREPLAAPLARAYEEYIFKGVSGISHTKRKKMSADLREIGRKIAATADASNYPFETEKHWQDLVSTWHLRFAIWGSQRLCFAGLYYAFENFLRECIGVVRREVHYKFQNIGQLTNDANAIFGKDVVGRCISCEFVQTARRIRNAIAHSGGKMTSEQILNSERVHYLVENGEIQIIAPNTRRLYEGLKPLATEIAQATLKVI